MSGLRGFIVVALGCASAGCWGNTTTEFPEGVEPLEENTAPLPQPAGGQEYPETFEVVCGESLDWDWCHLKGYIHAPILDVHQAFTDPEVVGDRRTATSLDFEFDTESEYDFSFTLHYFVDDFINVEWDEAWRYGFIAGDETAPEHVISRSQKVWGTEFIELVETSIIIQRVDDQTTLIEVIEHLDARSSGTGTIETWFEDLYASLLARVNGEPLPEY